MNYKQASKVMFMLCTSIGLGHYLISFVLVSIVFLPWGFTRSVTNGVASTLFDAGRPSSEYRSGENGTLYHKDSAVLVI